jgi:hypothetical protein
MKYLIPFHNFLNESKLEDIYSKYYADIETDIFNQLISADPTTIVKNGEVVKMGSYSKWLLQLFKTNNLKLEDLYKATEYLTSFDALKKHNLLSGQQADILSFKTLPDLFKVISEVGGTGKPTEDESYLIKDRFYINNGQAEVYFEDNDYLIVIPRTLEASQFYGKDTQWCTTKPDMFKHYSEKGNLYIIIDKYSLNASYRTRRVQFHFEERQFMDMDDSHLIKTKGIFAHYFKTHPDGFMLNYDDVGKPHGGRMWVGLNGKEGYVDLDGKLVIPIKFETAKDFSDGIAEVSLNGKEGYIDLDGNEIVPLIYDMVVKITKDRIKVKMGEKYGLLDFEGREILPVEYEQIHAYKDGVVKLKAVLNGNYVYMDNDGGRVQY